MQNAVQLIKKKNKKKSVNFCEWAQSHTHTHTQINKKSVNLWSCITHITLEIQTALHALPLKFKQLSPWLRLPLQLKHVYCLFL